jgi:hypothetical protein
MYFRFAAAILLVVAISLCGVAMEKSTLELKRDISRQEFQKEVLLEEHAQLRLKTQQLGAPTRVIESLDQETLKRRNLGNNRKPSSAPRQSQRQKTIDPRKRRLLLRWQRHTPTP